MSHEELKELKVQLEEFLANGYIKCRNLSLGLVTKVRACKVAGQERKPGSERKCEGMNPHTPKGASTLGVWNPSGLPNLQKAIARVKTQWIEEFLIPLEIY